MQPHLIPYHFGIVTISLSVVNFLLNFIRWGANYIKSQWGRTRIYVNFLLVQIFSNFIY